MSAQNGRSVVRMSSCVISVPPSSVWSLTVLMIVSMISRGVLDVVKRFGSCLGLLLWLEIV